MKFANFSRHFRDTKINDFFPRKQVLVKFRCFSYDKSSLRLNWNVLIGFCVFCLVHFWFLCFFFDSLSAVSLDIYSIRPPGDPSARFTCSRTDPRDASCCLSGSPGVSCTCRVPVARSPDGSCRWRSLSCRRVTAPNLASTSEKVDTRQCEIHGKFTLPLGFYLQLIV